MLLRKSIFTLLGLAIFLASLAVSCKEKPQASDNCSEHPGSCNSVLVAKEFFLFKPGSWWVYEEEYSGVRDSMYVYSYANGTDYSFDIRIISARDSFQYRYWPEYNGQPNDQNCSKTAPVIKKCMNIMRAKFRSGAPGVFISEGRCMFFQYNLYDSIPSYGGNFVNNYIRIKDILSSYPLGEFTFGETVKVNDKHDWQARDHETNHYFSRGVGMVRRELLDTTETWNLVNYHIEE